MDANAAPELTNAPYVSQGQESPQTITNLPQLWILAIFTFSIFIVGQILGILGLFLRSKGKTYPSFYYQKLLQNFLIIQFFAFWALYSVPFAPSLRFFLDTLFSYVIGFHGIFNSSSETSSLTNFSALNGFYGNFILSSQLVYNCGLILLFHAIFFILYGILKLIDKSININSSYPTTHTSIPTKMENIPVQENNSLFARTIHGIVQVAEEGGLYILCMAFFVEITIFSLGNLIYKNFSQSTSTFSFILSLAYFVGVLCLLVAALILVKRSKANMYHNVPNNKYAFSTVGLPESGFRSYFQPIQIILYFVMSTVLIGALGKPLVQIGVNYAIFSVFTLISFCKFPEQKFDKIEQIINVLLIWITKTLILATIAKDNVLVTFSSNVQNSIGVAICVFCFLIVLQNSAVMTIKVVNHFRECVKQSKVLEPHVETCWNMQTFVLVTPSPRKFVPSEEKLLTETQRFPSITENLPDQIETVEIRQERATIESELFTRRTERITTSDDRITTSVERITTSIQRITSSTGIINNDINESDLEVNMNTHCLPIASYKSPEKLKLSENLSTPIRVMSMTMVPTTGVLTKIMSRQRKPIESFEEKLTNHNTPSKYSKEGEISPYKPQLKNRVFSFRSILQENQQNNVNLGRPEKRSSDSTAGTDKNFADMYGRTSTTSNAFSNKQIPNCSGQQPYRPQFSKSFDKAPTQFSRSQMRSTCHMDSQTSLYSQNNHQTPHFANSLIQHQQENEKHESPVRTRVVASTFHIDFTDSKEENNVVQIRRGDCTPLSKRSNRSEHKTRREVSDIDANSQMEMYSALEDADGPQNNTLSKIKHQFEDMGWGYSEDENKKNANDNESDFSINSTG